MRLSSEGIALIKGFEGLELSAYRDKAGVYTIGYGSTRYHDGKPVRPGDRLANEAQASAIFSNTLAQYEDAVNKGITVPLSQHQFDALVSLAYNEGAGVMHGTTIARKLNRKDYTGAANQFLVWDKITDPATNLKVVCEDLVDRRAKERAYFLTGDTQIKCSNGQDV